MASRQPKWTGPKTHAVMVRYPGSSVWHKRGTYRHRTHARQALFHFTSTEPERDFRIVPLRARRKGVEVYQEIPEKEPSE